MHGIHWFLVLLMGALWGSSFVFTEILLETFHAHMIVLLRVLITGGVFVVFLLFYMRGRWIQNGYLFGVSRRQHVFLFVMSWLNVLLPFAFIAYGQTFITGGLASIFNATTAFFTIAVATIFIAEEKWTKNRLFGVLIGIMGVIIVVGYKELFTLTHESLGGLCVLLGAMCYGMAATWSKKKLQNIPTAVIVCSLYVYASVILFAYLWGRGALQFDLLTPVLFFNAFLFALLSSIIAFPMLFYLIGHIGAGNIGIATMATAPMAIILGAVFLDESILPSHILGFIVIVIGLLIIDGRPLKWIKFRLFS